MPGQTLIFCPPSARRLRVAGKQTALARWTRLCRPRPAGDGGEAARIRPFEFGNRAVIALGGIRMKQKVKGST